MAFIVLFSFLKGEFGMASIGLLLLLEDGFGMVL